MNRLLLFLLLAAAFQLKAQNDSLRHYTSGQLAYKSSMATRHFNENPALWKIYLDEMNRRNPSAALKSEIYYNLAWDFYRYTDNGIDYSINLMDIALDNAKKAGNTVSIMFCYDGLGCFYALKNDLQNALACLKEITNLTTPNSKNDLEYIKFQGGTSRIYSWIGDFERAITVIKKANHDIDNYLNTHPKLPNETRRNLIYDKQGNYNRMVESYNFQKKLDSAAIYIQKSKQLEKAGYNLYHNSGWNGEVFYLILSKRYDEAIERIKEADRNAHIDSKDQRYRSYYYLALCWSQKENHKESLAYCEKAIAIPVKITSFFNFQLETYKLASSNAIILGDTEKANFYIKKLNDFSQEYENSSKSRFVADLYKQDVIAVKEQLSEQNKKILFLAISVVIIILLVFIFLTRIYLKRKIDKKKFQSAMLQTEETEALQKSEIEEEIKINDEVPLILKNNNASGETDQKIAKQLIGFEKKEQFLSPNLTINSMCKSFNTNSSYLSAAIKKHRGKNFNTYINDLRIDYLVFKLKNNPEYLTYKTIYLAEICGFGSYAVFHRAFLLRTGISPSKFISFLKSEEKL